MPVDGSLRSHFGVLNVFRLQNFRRRQSAVVGNPIHTGDATRLDSFVASGLSRRVGRCESGKKDHIKYFSENCPAYRPTDLTLLIWSVDS